jgi:hypothetical protein
LSGHRHFDSISLADGSALASLHFVSATQPSRHDKSNPSQTHIGTNPEEVNAYLPSTKAGQVVRLKNQRLANFAISLNLPACDAHPVVRRVCSRSAVEFSDKKDANASTLGGHRILNRSKKRHDAMVSIKPVMDTEVVDHCYISSVTPHAAEFSEKTGRANCDDDFAKHAGEAFG